MQKSAELNEKYRAFDYYNEKLEDNFLEFTLEELGMPSAKWLHEQTIKIKDEIGGIKGWQRVERETKTYKGFSICINPNGDDHLRGPYASLGHPELNWAYSRMNNPNPPWKDDKDTYYDTYGLSTVHPIVKKHYDKFLDCVDLLPTRGRVMWAYPGFVQKWHLDEVLWSAIRFNIPLVTEPSYVLEIDGEDDFGNSLTLTKHLEVGKVYMWNTKIKHRVRDVGGATKPRLHIVAAFIPWFEKSGDDWKPNKWFGMQPMEMIKSKMIFPYAP
tara:strand:+ start:73 stop:885 length:813 start_codon:yes stop_codon:yes gene_type:complete